MRGDSSLPQKRNDTTYTRTIAKNNDIDGLNSETLSCVMKRALLFRFGESSSLFISQPKPSSKSERLYLPCDDQPCGASKGAEPRQRPPTFGCLTSCAFSGVTTANE